MTLLPKPTSGVFFSPRSAKQWVNLWAKSECDDLTPTVTVIDTPKGDIMVLFGSKDAIWEIYGPGVPPHLYMGSKELILYEFAIRLHLAFQLHIPEYDQPHTTTIPDIDWINGLYRCPICGDCYAVEKYATNCITIHSIHN